MPETARSSTDFSFSSVDWKSCVEVLSWLARLRREVVRSSCSRREVERASSLVVSEEDEAVVLKPVVLAGGAGFCLVWGALRLRRVDCGTVVAVLEGVDADVDVVGGIGVVVGSFAAGLESSVIGAWVDSTATGFENKSFHSSSSESSSSASSSSSARDSSSSRTLCIRFRSCLSRAISACASCRRSSGLICGRARSSWDSRVRA